tara:strand:- start:21 stop:530 length:510 start_codon:yes stop_codon:yes gene_type:complete
MTLIKTRARGLKLDDTFAFTGTVSGTKGIINITQETNSTRTSLTASNEITFFSFNYNQQKANSKIRVDCVLWGDGNGSGITRNDLLYDGSIVQTGRASYQYLSQQYVHCIFGHYFFNGASTTGNKAVIFKQDIENTDTGRPFVTWNPNSTDDGRMSQLTSYLTITEFDL